ncbi:MAG: peroxiredoxin [Bdellovibrionales bacterium]|nr:peroxiredoxin [Bdellovibrionales bacterium]
MKKITLLVLTFLSLSAFGDSDLKVGDPAKSFKLQTQEGKEFDLASRKGTWTVLYFFPKAETPGCTKQACSFRDNIKKIRNLKAEVFGISTNNVKDQAEFAKAHALNFILLADNEGEVTNLYGSKMAIINMSKRWTFIIDPNLVIRDIAKDVDPITDAQRVATKISELQKN